MIGFCIRLRIGSVVLMSPAGLGGWVLRDRVDDTLTINVISNEVRGRNLVQAMGLWICIAYKFSLRSLHWPVLAHRNDRVEYSVIVRGIYISKKLYIGFYLTQTSRHIKLILCVSQKE